MGNDPSICIEVVPNRSGTVSPTLASPLWLIRELSRQGRRLFLCPKEKAAKAAFLFESLSRLTSLSYSVERFSEISVSKEKFSPVDDAVTEHGTTECGLSTNDRNRGTYAAKS